MKRKQALLGLGGILGVPVRKSWTKERIVTCLARTYEDNPEVLFHVLSKQGADFLRRMLRNPCASRDMRESVHEELAFLGLAANRRKSGRKTDRPVEDSHGPVEESLFGDSATRTFLLGKRHAGLIRRLDGMEMAIRGMLRAYGLLDMEDLAALAVECFPEPPGPGGHRESSRADAEREEVMGLLRRRLSLRAFIRTYEDGEKTYLLHPSVTDPERLKYSILASPVKGYRKFTFEELVRMGEGEETSGEAFIGLMDLFGRHPYREAEKADGNPADGGRNKEGSDNRPADGKEAERRHREEGLRDGEKWEKALLHLKLRIREGAPNLEIVREVMERLFFEDHQEVSHFLERFISHCDDIPRWNLKGYRMNEI